MKNIDNTAIMTIDKFRRQDILKISEHFDEITLDIMNGSSFTDIAKKYKLSTKTIYRLRKSEEFQARLKEQKKRCFESALNQASYLSSLAVGELKNILLNKEVSAQNKIQACKTILELAKNNYEYENIEERIEELENLIKDK